MSMSKATDLRNWKICVMGYWEYRAVLTLLHPQ
jgi:hypothetical protein